MARLGRRGRGWRGKYQVLPEKVLEAAIEPLTGAPRCEAGGLPSR